MYSVVPVDPKVEIHVAFMYCMPPQEGTAIEDIARSYWRADPKAFGVDFAQTSPVELVIPCDLVVTGILSVIE